MISSARLHLKDIAAHISGEIGGWLFIFKMTLAVILAMWISIRFELGQPSTAMITFFVLMQPQTGMVLTKSIYRAFGTIFGTLATLVLFFPVPTAFGFFHLCG
jgi:uncharacterized membrane protein YccC